MKYRYTPMAILPFLHIQGLCRPGARAKHALASACRLLFGNEGKPLSDHIEADLIHSGRKILSSSGVSDRLHYVHYPVHFFEKVNFFLQNVEMAFL